MKTLVLGGVKSGKSRIAESFAAQTNRNVIYVATAQAHDDEMRNRIFDHRNRRPEHWTTIEEPLRLAHIVRESANESNCILIDCLTLWLTNLLLHSDRTILEKEIDAFIKSIEVSSADIILVSNETNMGVTPLGELTRKYCDEVGVLHQRVAELCNRVLLVVAGLPLYLKNS